MARIDHKWNPMRLCFYLEPLEPRLTLSAGFIAADGIPGGAHRLELIEDQLGAPQFFFQRDGKFIATDNFPDDGPECSEGWSEYLRIYFVRFNPDASRDKTFGDDGIVNNFLCSEQDDFAQFLQLPNGKIIGRTYQNSILRFGAGGRLDASFNTSAKLPIPFPVREALINQMALTPDGRIIVAGETWAPHTNPQNGRLNHLFLLRLKPDGTIDPSFGNQGAVDQKYLDSFGWASAVTVQSDGKILVTAGAYGDEYGRNAGTLLRFNPDGTPDESFASHGQFQFPDRQLGGPILLQPDGKIIVVLGNDYYSGRRSQPDLILLRLNSDGSIDKSFGLDGRSSSRWHGQNYWDKFFIQPDGKILAIENDGIVVRFTSTGALDPTFGFGGSMLLATGDTALDFTVDDASLRPDGHLLLLLQQDNCWGDCDEFSEYLADITTDSTQPSRVSSADGSLIIQPFAPESVTTPPSAGPPIIRRPSTPQPLTTPPSESFDTAAAISDSGSQLDHDPEADLFQPISNDPLDSNDPDAEDWLN